MENNKTQRGGARSAPPLWGGAEGAALLFSIWQWKPGIKNLMEIVFLLRAGPTFGPKLKTGFGWCWPLIKNPPWEGFLIREPITAAGLNRFIQVPKVSAGLNQMV